MTDHDDDEAFREVEAITDELDQLVAAHQLVQRYQRLNTQAAELRRRLLRRFLDLHPGTENAVLARKLRISGSRVSRLLNEGIRPERALLGRGDVTIAAGGKMEPNDPRRADPSVMISREAFQATDLLAQLVTELGWTATTEIVGPPGNIHLNRPNLVVLCSPRLLPIVGQVLESDPHVGFDMTDQGRWCLIDRGTDTVYESPSDTDGISADFAYLGRLPRPDGRGTFLYLAGIHAMGTLGAAQFLATNLNTIWQQVRTRRWSMIVRVNYDPKKHEVTQVTPVTPVYREGA